MDFREMWQALLDAWDDFWSPNISTRDVHTIHLNSGTKSFAELTAIAEKRALAKRTTAFAKEKKHKTGLREARHMKTRQGNVLRATRRASRHIGN